MTADHRALLLLRLLVLLVLPHDRCFLARRKTRLTVQWLVYDASAMQLGDGGNLGRAAKGFFKVAAA